MKTKIEILLQSINLASYDNIDTLEVSITDLMSLRKEILELREDVTFKNKQINMLKNDNTILIGKMIDRPRQATNIGYYFNKIS